MIKKEVKEEQRFKEIWNSWNSGFVTGWYYMPSFSSNKILNYRIRTEGGAAIQSKS